MTRVILLCATLGLVVTALVAAKPSDKTAGPLPDKIDFNRDIRPILSDNCFYCHGPDKNKRKADLRLDTKEGLFTERKGKFPAVAGQPDESEIVRRIVTSDPDDLMPPPETGKKLTPRQIALIRRWIEQGVDFKGHWLYVPPTRPPVPREQARQVKNDIDRFIVARLKAEGLKPSAEADRATLARRVAFDVTGLPPTPQQVAAFVNDPSPNAYERLVDELFASPHYGERMAMYWFDLVRFADTVGYHGDRPMNIHPFRDYVIRSFNDNKPFDLFTTEQLAGDLVPNPTPETKIASGYNRLNMMSEEGGIQDKEYLAKYAIDRVRNFSGVWLGSTMGCAECHDHKFDPFSARDTYRMEAFFADITERGYYGGLNNSGNWGEVIQVPSPEQSQQVKQLDAKLAELRGTLNAPSAELESAQAEWERVSRTKVWTALNLVEAKSENGSEFKSQEDGSILAIGPSPDKDVYVVTFTTPLQGITAFRLEVLPDPSFPGQGPGRFQNGNFVLNEFELLVNGTPVKLVDPSASFEQEGLKVTGAIDGKPQAGGWAISPQFGKAHQAVFQTATDLGDGSPTSLTFKLHQHQGKQHTIGKFRITATTGQRPNTTQELPANIVEILAVDPAQLNDAQKAALKSHFRSIVPQLKEVRDQIAAVEAQRKQLDTSIPTTLVTVARAEPRAIRVLHRGNWMDDTGEVVEPGVPHFLPQIEKQGRANRLDLAQWVIRRDNPIVARVFVNRLWKLAFGAGLSRNITDMGSQGEWPTHPELLDWLAVEFMESGWDIKHMFKLMVMSGTYRQSSLVRKELKEKDPFNKLYARQSRFRLDAEMVRDQALAVSGLLVRDLFGPSAKPYQPPGYYAYLNFPPREYQADKGEGLYRRGVYTWWQRQYLHPSLLAFDAPSREECTAERPRSNTPLQSLVLLNDPSYVEAARVFAEKIVREGGTTPEDRISWAMRRVLVRDPSQQEVAVLAALYQTHLAQYQQDPSGAEQLLTVGDKPAPADLDKPDLAAWTSVARAILNLNEAITRN